MRGRRGAAGASAAVRVLAWCGVGAFVAAAGAACGRSASAGERNEDVLVLELGGEYASLHDTLEKRGLIRRPRVEAEDVPLPDRGAPTPSPSPGPDAGSDPPPAPVVPPPGPAAVEFVEVPLERGETLMHVAKKHLGSARRYRELMVLNGWSEDDARRLRDGTIVKVPKPPR